MHVYTNYIVLMNACVQMFAPSSPVTHKYQLPVLVHHIEVKQEVDILLLYIQYNILNTYNNNYNIIRQSLHSHTGRGPFHSPLASHTRCNEELYELIN